MKEFEKNYAAKKATDSKRKAPVAKATADKINEEEEKNQEDLAED